MSVELVIDVRETKLINIIRESSSQTILITKALDIGDIQIKRGDDILVLIERKTVSDLKSSICDGRAKEQKARIMGSGIPIERILYLIEGNISTEKQVSLLGSIINTQFRDGIKVYKTESILETSLFVVKLYEKFLSEKFLCEMLDMSNKIDSTSYLATLKQKKKDNMTPKVWFISQLSLIPQVSISIAIEIVKKYPLFTDLYNEYEKNPIELRKNLLSEIKLANGRRLGNKLSEKIYKFVYGIDL